MRYPDIYAKRGLYFHDRNNDDRFVGTISRPINRREQWRATIIGEGRDVHGLSLKEHIRASTLGELKDKAEQALLALDKGHTLAESRRQMEERHARHVLARGVKKVRGAKT